MHKVARKHGRVRQQPVGALYVGHLVHGGTCIELESWRWGSICEMAAGIEAGLRVAGDGDLGGRARCSALAGEARRPLRHAPAAGGAARREEGAWCRVHIHAGAPAKGASTQHPP
jgi:hypothetical protein